MKKLTKRDISVIKYVEKYGFVTIKQAANFAFNNNEYATDIARRRLNAIVELGYLQTTTIGSTKVFYIEDKYANVSLHMIVTMNLYSSLIRYGAEILYFKREQSWLEGQRRSDAFCIFKRCGYYYAVAEETLESSSRSRGETPYTHNSKYTAKYRTIMNTNEHNKLFQEVTGIDKRIPLTLLIVDDVDHGEKWKIDVEEIETFTDNFSLDNIFQIF